MNNPAHSAGEAADLLLPEATFRDCAGRLTAVLEDYLRESRRGRAPVIALRSIPRLRTDLGLDRWLENGGMTPPEFEAFVRTYLERTTRLHHPGYIGHQVATPLLPSALADFLNGVVNNPMAIHEMGPPAVAVEFFVLEWMARKIGWTAPEAGGLLTHGGSLANLTALAAAREAALPGSARSGVTRPLAILAPESVHYSIRRAAAILGLGTDAVYSIAVDERGVLDPSALAPTLARARADGRHVLAVVAVACATVTGLYDPLEETGRFCRAHDLWFHVDGAHGASALLSDKERHRLRGAELADSFVWDAHKMLGTSALCAAIVLRDAGALETAFREHVPYLGSHGEERRPEAGVDLIHRSIECTKAALGLKLFLNIAFFGERGLARHVEELYASTRHFYHLIRTRPGFECAVAPESNILLFRRSGSDELQRAIRQKLLDRGHFYITEAAFRGRHWLRLSVMNPATSERTIEGLLAAVDEATQEESTGT